MHSKNIGNAFEKIFYHSCNAVPGLQITRFPDGCKRAGPNLLIPVKTPFDWILTYKGKSAFIDTKTNAQGFGFPHSLIEDHQIYEMTGHERCGAIAGYVIWLRKPDRIIFAPSVALDRRARITGSVKWDDQDVVLLGSGSEFDATKIFIPYRDQFEDTHG